MCVKLHSSAIVQVSHKLQGVQQAWRQWWDGNTLHLELCENSNCSNICDGNVNNKYQNEWLQIKSFVFDALVGDPPVDLLLVVLTSGNSAAATAHQQAAAHLEVNDEEGTE